MPVRILGREPALALNTLAALLGLAVTFNLGLTDEQAGWTVAVISAVLGGIAAAFTRPVPVQAFTTLVATAASALAAFGYHADPTTTAAVNGAVLAVLMFVTRGQVTPTIRPTAP